MIKEEKSNENEENNIIKKKEEEKDIKEKENEEKPKTDKFRVVKKIIKGNKIIKQMIGRLKEGDKEKDIIISSVEEYTNLEDKKKKEKEKEKED